MWHTHATPRETRPDLWKRIPSIAARWRRKEITDAECAALYFLHGQMARCGVRFASRKSKTHVRPVVDEWLTLLEWSRPEDLQRLLLAYLEQYHFLGVIPNVPAALAGWLRAEWNLILTDRIPQPEEVLRLQAGGRRPVTLVAEYPRLMQPVLEKPDGWAFLVHDLEHAFKFFHDPRMHAGQRRLFDLLFRALERGFFVSMRQDPIFSRQFDYLISDMNTHVIHSLRYLVAVLIDCCLRAEGKDSAASLSPAAEASLADFLAALAANWQLGVAAAGALQRLTFDRFSTADADIIERAILNP